MRTSAEVESQVVVGAGPPAVFSRWMYVMSVNTPVLPVVDDAPSSSHGIAPAIVEFAEAILVPLTMLPSVEVQFGPMPR